LEDNPERIKKFKQMFRKHDITVTDQAEKAIEYLKENKYDFILLDHDLGGDVYVDSNYKNTGYQVAKHISETMNKDTKILVHSFNPVGAKNMLDILPNANHMPFGTFNENILSEIEDNASYEQLKLFIY